VGERELRARAAWYLARGVRHRVGRTPGDSDVLVTAGRRAALRARRHAPRARRASRPLTRGRPVLPPARL